MKRTPHRADWLFRLARPYVRRQLARSLDGLHVAGLEETRAVVAAGPCIFVANHAAWWDPLLAVALDEALDAEGYALMDAENLCRFPVFTRLGGVPLYRARPRSALRTAARLLEAPRRAVLVFPQGRERPAHLRPLAFRPGVRLLARMAPAGTRVVPIGFQYIFRNGHYPAAFASLGPGLPAERIARGDGVAAIERAVEGELERIDRAITSDESTFEALVPSKLRRPDEGGSARMLDRMLGRHG